MQLTVADTSNLMHSSGIPPVSRTCSDVVVQIVDARNPLLYRCEDLERYVKEMSPRKVNAVLMNKSDLLTEAQR